MRNVLLLLTIAPIGCAPSRQRALIPVGGEHSGDFGGCEPERILQPGCEIIDSEPVELPQWCQFAQGIPSVFTDAEQWSDFLARCDTDLIDPVPDLDWSAWNVVGTVVWASGCSGTHGTLWVADCAERQHLGYWSNGCGDCEQSWVTTHFVKVPAGRVDTLLLETCVPEGEACAEEE